MRTAFFLLFSITLTLFSLRFCGAEEGIIPGRCLTCHKEVSSGLYQQWSVSAHAKYKVTCYDCHRAAKGDADAFQHEGALIATLVTPKDCGKCHPGEFEQVDRSHHAKAGMILESNDAYMAQVVGGYPAAIAGCESCHGAKVVVSKDSPNRLSKASWPNSGIGRLNPDGSKGACNACHSRHNFSKAQARQPETCGKCHLGPDHPQKEVYEESKHGIAYFTNIDKMNLDSDRWEVGRDYYQAPTCATCHMSSVLGQKLSHDVGTRLAWTLRPMVSVYQKDWARKRENMMGVCSACHSRSFVEGHFYQFDALVRLYNRKFAEPSQKIMEILKKNGSLPRKAAFSNDIEWIFWELWHHEGRRARHGAAMMGPDYTWWHGIYEVGKHFYFEFIPAARELGDSEAAAYIDSLLERDPMHNWMSRSTEELKKAIRSGKIQKTYLKLFQSGGGDGN